MNDVRKITRRAFIAAVGVAGAATGGLLLSGKTIPVMNRVFSALEPTPSLLTLFVRIGTDNRITLVSHRVEMGQGIKTGLPLVIADEMNADWQLVDVIQAAGDERYGDQDTDGSKSVRLFYDLMRELGATARYMLEQAASLHWNVPVQECRALHHQVFHLPTQRSVAFGDLATTAASLPLPSRDQLRLKSPDEFVYIGKQTASHDIPAMVSGAAIYAGDVQLPDLLVAVVEHPPVLGAQLLSMDDSAARKISGVVDIVVLPPLSFPVAFQPLHGVAVVATNTWAALKARRLLKCEWSESKYSSRSSASLHEQMKAEMQKNGQIVSQRGDVDQAFANAAHVHTAQYAVPYLAHASMEPPVAVADVGTFHCRLWASTQNPQNVRNALSQLLKLPVQRVEVNVPLLGGGFGRKSKGDFCAQAALIAKAVKRPVKLLWTREDDIRCDYYHAMSVQQVSAALNEQNHIIGWRQQAAYPSIATTFDSSADRPGTGELSGGFLNTPYELDNFRAESHPAQESVRIGWLRSVTNIQHAFANNCFADEIAQIRGTDTLTQILELMGSHGNPDPTALQIDHPSLQQHPFEKRRLQQVLNVVVENSGYLPSKKGWGLACHYCFLSYCAAACRVEVVEDRLTVKEVHIALDCGQIVNRDRVKAQLEGAVIFGLSIALLGNITIENGQVQQSNFHDYPVLRMEQAPVITTHLIESNAPPSGVGESGVPVVAPSVVNAVFSVTGERFRELPLSKRFKV